MRQNYLDTLVSELAQAKEEYMEFMEEEDDICKRRYERQTRRKKTARKANQRFDLQRRCSIYAEDTIETKKSLGVRFFFSDQKPSDFKTGEDILVDRSVTQKRRNASRHPFAHTKKESCAKKHYDSMNQAKCKAKEREAIIDYFTDYFTYDTIHETLCEL